MIITLKHELDTQNFAQEFGSKLNGGETVGLIGKLGAGKTTFTRYLCQSIGCAERASSPTFVLEHEYRSPQLLVEHWDLYRLDKLPDELLQPPDAKTIRLIEWADKFSDLTRSCDYRISFSVKTDAERTATLETGQQEAV